MRVKYTEEERQKIYNDQYNTGCSGCYFPVDFYIVCDICGDKNYSATCASCKKEICRKCNSWQSSWDEGAIELCLNCHFSKQETINGIKHLMDSLFYNEKHNLPTTE